MKWALVVSVLLLSAQSHATAKVPARHLVRSNKAVGKLGSVTYLTHDRAFISAGTADGLAVGSTVQLFRRGQHAVACKLTTAAEHQSTCPANGIQVGDAVQVSNPQKAQVKSPPALVSEDELLRRRRTLEQAPIPEVEFRGRKSEAASSGKVSVEASHTSWSYFNGENTGFQQERVDAQVAGALILPATRLYVDLSALYYSALPPNARLSPPGATRLYVRRTELTRRDNQSEWVGAIGRIWPYAAPGAQVLDGLQAGWRSRSGELETGMFGGALPNPFSLEPTSKRWTLGAYGAFTQQGDVIRLWRQSTRLAFVETAEAGPRFEAETAFSAYFLKKVDVAADVRLGLGQKTAPAFIDVARLDVNVRPAEVWKTGVSIRYVGFDLTSPLMALGSPSQNRSFHSDLTASWQPNDVFMVSAYSGYERDLVTLLWRNETGLELALPKLFGKGGAALGYQQEFGWWGLRMAYFQANAMVANRLHLIGRFTYTEDTPASGTGNFTTRTPGAYAAADFLIPPLFKLRASALVHEALAWGNGALHSTSTTGVVASAGVVGTF